MDRKAYRFRELVKEELPHYSKGNVDLEIRTSYGYIEVAGNAYRTDWDLTQQGKASGHDLSVISGEKRLVPHVVEASMGSGRLLFALLENSAVEDAEGAGTGSGSTLTSRRTLTPSSRCRRTRSSSRRRRRCTG